MTGEPNPNPKKLKIDSGSKADGRVTITIPQDATSKDASYGTFFEGNRFFIELQGEQSVGRKLNSVCHWRPSCFTKKYAGRPNI